MKKKLIQFSFFILSLSFTLIYSDNQSSSNNSKFYSWYENYLLNQKDEIEHLDAQLLGKSAKNFILRGLILESGTKKGIQGARVSLYASSEKMIASAQTDENGFFNFSNETPESQALRIEVKAKGYSTANRFLTPSVPLHGLEFSMLRADTINIHKGDSQTLEESTGNARLKLHADILKRLDGKQIIFPVQIQLSYINPETHLASMPGILMLTQEANLATHPLTSSGAVLIEALDSSGAPVRIDREKEKKTGFTSELLIRVKDGKLPKGTTGWEIDSQKGDFAWKSSQAIISGPHLKVPENSTSPLSANFLIQYAKDVANRINQRSLLNQGVGSGCFEGNYFTTDQVRFNPKSSPEIIFNSLLTYMAEDLALLLNKTRTDLCLAGEYSDSYTYGLNPWDIYDALILPEQLKSNKALRSGYPAGSYRCDISKDDRYNYLAHPNQLTAGFDYIPLLKLQSSICGLLKEKEAQAQLAREKKNWENALSVKSLDLIPFNLDKPWNGVPISLKLKENNGDGTFKLSLKIKTEFGCYETDHFLNSGKNPVTLNLLLPEGNPLEILVKTRLNAERWKLAKTIKLPRATTSYKWNSKEKKELETAQGNKPNWIELEPIFFDE